tara:strand:+ start:5688 stop:6359 length:672 start_codon:yes stop_codon:yes gene_type:complete
MKIQELKLFTSKIKAQAEFYSQVLELSIIDRSDNHVSFQIGKSILHFEYDQAATPYHFAINIPSNKENEALKWLKSRLEILKDGQDEIINFNAWNAKAIYFYDQDNNIMELIARKNLNNTLDGKFGSDQLLEISEIGVPTPDIESEFQNLSSILDIPIYDGGFGNFCAVGDENGLFIFINKDSKNWYPTQDKAFPSAFELKLSQKGKIYGIGFKNGKIDVLDA